MSYSTYRHGIKPALPAFAAIVLAFSPAAAVAGQASFASYPPQPSGVTSINVTDLQGRFVGRILPQKRYWVTLDHIPEFLQKALVGIEDSRFYEHGGIDVRGIARALLTDVVKGRLAEGGSTITQQLIKNKYLSAEVSIDRKLKEARMAMDFEKQYSKQQILEMYFNEIYYGNGAWGIAQAARLYFDKRPEELSPGECVLLAGVPKNPNRYNPLGKPADVSGRRSVVVKRLVDLNIISPLQGMNLQGHPAPAREPNHAPQYLSQIRTQLVERYGPDIIEQGGLDVTAAIDMNLQKQAERALHDGAKRISPSLEGALVCLDPANGDVLAAVGDVDDAQNAMNRAFSARRQPGSSIKPLIYAAALEKGFTAGSIWNDTPVSYPGANGETWRPLNDGREQYGDISLRQALAHSNNIITVKLLKAIGVPYFVDFAGRMGVPLHAQNGLSLALGTDDVTLNELVQAYTPLVTGGMRAEARTIVRIHDRRRNQWLENPPAITPVLSPAAAFITTQMMKDVMVYGTAKNLRHFSMEHPSAGKTGTTDSHMDAWFVGYTPQLLAGVWVGYDRPRPGGRGFTGGLAAAPIWERFMRRAVTARPAGDFVKPDSVVSVAIDPATGTLANDQSPRRQNEFYIAGTEPKGDNPTPASPADVPAAPTDAPATAPGPTVPVPANPE